jgi:coproporphyrinogen III oxidase
MTSRRYFYIPCRKEHRGIGGLFFDDVASGEAGYDAEARARPGPVIPKHPLGCFF